MSGTTVANDDLELHWWLKTAPAMNTKMREIPSTSFSREGSSALVKWKVSVGTNLFPQCGGYGGIVGCPCTTLRDNSCSKAQHHRFSVRFNSGGCWDATARALWEEPQPLTVWLYGGGCSFHVTATFLCLVSPFPLWGWASSRWWLSCTGQVGKSIWRALLLKRGLPRDHLVSIWEQQFRAYGTIPQWWCFFFDK